MTINWQCIKDRFVKYDTLHGLYMVPLGIVGIWVVLWHFQYVLHVMAALIFMYAIIEGLRKFLSNPAKYEAKLKVLREKYVHLFEKPDVK